MRFDKEITSLVLIGLSIVVTVLAAVAVGMIDSSVMGALAAPPSHGFEMLQTGDNSMGILGLAIGAGLVLGLTGIGAALGMGTASAAALGAITEKPETFGKSILYVVFIEAVAIYGFVIAFLLVGYIPLLID
ncbi:MAG: ATPase [Candidatus Thorarchaeota archaeon]|nr:ATPase [Candidatus Thorarchaeota archaeon]